MTDGVRVHDRPSPASTWPEGGSPHCRCLDGWAVCTRSYLLSKACTRVHESRNRDDPSYCKSRADPRAWVQESLSKATSAANKAAINAELKQVGGSHCGRRCSLQILFDAHKNGTVNTTDWSKVQLNSLVPAVRPNTDSRLKNQASRSYPSLSTPAPAVHSTYQQSYSPQSASSYTNGHAASSPPAAPTKKDKKNKKRKG